MCLYRALRIPVMIRVRAPWLSQLIGSNGESLWELWISFYIWSNHFASLEPSREAMNSVSTVDIEIRPWFRDCNMTARLLARMTWLTSDFWSMLCLAQSESDYPTTQLPMSILVSLPMQLLERCSRISAVDLRYRRTLLAAFLWLLIGHEV